MGKLENIEGRSEQLLTQSIRRVEDSLSPVDSLKHAKRYISVRICPIHLNLRHFR